MKVSRLPAAALLALVGCGGPAFGLDAQGSVDAGAGDERDDVDSRDAGSSDGSAGVEEDSRVPALDAGHVETDAEAGSNGCPAACSPWSVQACQGSFTLYACTTSCAEQSFNADGGAVVCQDSPIEWATLFVASPCSGDGDCAEAGPGLLCKKLPGYSNGFCYPPDGRGGIALTCCPR